MKSLAAKRWESGRWESGRYGVIAFGGLIQRSVLLGITHAWFSISPDLPSKSLVLVRSDRWGIWLGNGGNRRLRMVCT
jgi:hypothetical protein